MLGGEVIESLSGPDKALLAGSKPVAANEHHAILAFESNFNAGQTMKRDNLNTMFGNILSQVAGFSPEIFSYFTRRMARSSSGLSLLRLNHLKDKLSRKMLRSQLLPQGFEFFSR